MRKLKIYNAESTANIDLNSNNYLASELSGLGAGFNIKELGGRVYDMESQFEDISILIHFGVRGNAYQSFKDFMAFLLANGNNKLILEYDYDGNKRYCDVYPRSIPKSQKEMGVISETIVLRRMTPWYEKVTYGFTGSLGQQHQIENISLWPIELVLEIWDLPPDNPTRFMMTTPSGAQELVVNPANLDKIVIDAERKKAYNPANGLSVYKHISKQRNTFLIAPPNGTSILQDSTGVMGSVHYKKWVLD